ncbi:MAG: hypothetical protein JJE36_03675 [Coriobacteriia bacterium]|nr:hypothetical protein [Coriobacteriia bacterium]
MHSQTLQELLSELYSDSECQIIHAMYPGSKLDLAVFTGFDYAIAGPSVLTIAQPGFGGGTLNMPGQGVGRYTISDREVFRPLQYASAHLMMVREDASWLARSVVVESAAHIEALLKRVGRRPRLPFGALLHEKSVEAALDEITYGQARRFAPINNSAKHDFDHPKDTHMFSYGDALSAYFICRRLAMQIYPLAALSTDMSVFECPPAGFDPVTGHLTSASN